MTVCGVNYQPENAILAGDCFSGMQDCVRSKALRHNVTYTTRSQCEGRRFDSGTRLRRLATTSARATSAA